MEYVFEGFLLASLAVMEDWKTAGSISSPTPYTPPMRQEPFHYLTNMTGKLISHITVIVKVNEPHTWQCDWSQVAPSSAFACKHKCSCRHTLPIVKHREPAWHLSIRIHSWLLSSLREISSNEQINSVLGAENAALVHLLLSATPSHKWGKTKDKIIIKKQTRDGDPGTATAISTLICRGWRRWMFPHHT